MITLSRLAAEKIALLFREEGVPTLRMSVEPGHCSGYQYGMALGGEPADGDAVMEAHGVRVVVDQASLPLVLGAEVDYVESLMQTGFIVRNPNAASTCTCGQSFHTTNPEEARTARH